MFNLQAVPDQKTIRKLVTNLFLKKRESKKGGLKSNSQQGHSNLTTIIFAMKTII